MMNSNLSGIGPQTSRIANLGRTLPIARKNLRWFTRLFTLTAFLVLVIGVGAWLLIRQGLIGGNIPDHRYVAFDVAPDGKRIAFSAADGNLYLLDLLSLRVTSLTQSDRLRSNPAFSPDGKHIAYSEKIQEGEGASIFLRNLEGTGVVRLTNDSDVSDAMPSFSADGSHVVFARAHRHRLNNFGGWKWDDWDVYVVAADGGQPQRITHQKYSRLVSPRLSQDGRYVLYSADVPYDTRYFDRQHGGTVTTLLEAPTRGDSSPKPLLAGPPAGLEIGAWGSEPHLTTDGKQLVFVSDRNEPYHYDLWLMDMQGGVPKSLDETGGSHYIRNPVFASDARSLFFLADTGTAARAQPVFSLWRVDMDGKNGRRIADDGLFTAPLHWTPKP